MRKHMFNTLIFRYIQAMFGNDFKHCIHCKFTFFQSIFIACSLLIHLNVAFASTKVDSLKNELATDQLKDQNKVDVLIEVAMAQWKIDPKESMQYAEQAMNLSEELKYERGRGFGHLANGLGLWRLQDFNGAMSEFIEAIEIQEKKGDSADICETKYFVATAYAMESVTDIANKYFNEINRYYHNTGNLRKQALAYTGIGLSWLIDNQFDKALPPLNKALEIHNGMNHPVEKAVTLCLMGKTLGGKGLNLEGIVQLEKAKKIFEEYNNVLELGKVYFALGEIYLNMKEYDKSSEYFLKSLEYLEETYDWNAIEQAYKSLKKLEVERGDFKQALFYYEKYTELTSRYATENVSNKVHELKMKYDEEQALIKIELLNKEKKIKNLYILALSLLILIISISSVIIAVSFRKNRIKDKELHESNRALMESEIANSKLKEKELETELERQNMKLTSYTMSFIQKSTLFKELSQVVSELMREDTYSGDRRIVEMENIVNRNLSVEKDWKDFNTYFENVYPSFIQKLKELEPGISAADVKLCTLLKLNLNSKQIADILGISPDSVKTARYRLRTKLNLDKGQNLVDFLANMD